MMRSPWRTCPCSSRNSRVCTAALHPVLSLPPLRRSPRLANRQTRPPLRPIHLRTPQPLQLLVVEEEEEEEDLLLRPHRTLTTHSPCPRRSSTVNCTDPPPLRSARLPITSTLLSALPPRRAECRHHRRLLLIPTCIDSSSKRSIGIRRCPPPPSAVRRRTHSHRARSSSSCSSSRLDRLTRLEPPILDRTALQEEVERRAVDFKRQSRASLTR